jgi:hypothetical protein
MNHSVHLRRPNGHVHHDAAPPPAAEPETPPMVTPQNPAPIVQPRGSQSTVFTAFVGVTTPVTGSGYVTFDYQTVGAAGDLMVEIEFPGSGHSSGGGPPYYVATHCLNALLSQNKTAITWIGNTNVRLHNIGTGPANCTITVST